MYAGSFVNLALSTPLFLPLVRRSCSAYILYLDLHEVLAAKFM